MSIEFECRGEEVVRFAYKFICNWIESFSALSFLLKKAVMRILRLIQLRTCQIC